MDSVLHMLAEARDTEMAWRLHLIISHVPVDVLLRRESALLDAPNLPDEVLKRLNRRKDFSGLPAAKLWQDLQDFAERSKDKHYVGEIDHAYADDLVEALDPTTNPTRRRSVMFSVLSERMENGSKPSSWTSWGSGDSVRLFRC